MPRNRNNYERQRPADQVSQDVRDAWRELKFHEFMDKLREKATGCVVRVCSMKNRHIKITGPGRAVDLYATTGTINAAPFKSMKAARATGMKPERAVERALALSTHGY